MALQKKGATPPPAEDNSVNFDDDALFAGGFSIPEGDYLLVEAKFANHVGFGEKKYAPKLSLVLTWAPLTAPQDESGYKHQALGLGTKANQSFQPHPDNDKRIVPVAGAIGATLNDSTNFAIWREELKNAGLPKGVWTNDVGVLEGMWAHLRDIPEPESRKNIKSKATTGDTGEVTEERQGNGKITVVSAILDGGAPWEGGGGWPEEKPAAAKPKAAAGPKGVVKPAAKPAPAPVEEAGNEADEGDVAAAVEEAFTDVLSRPGNEEGLGWLMLRTETFKIIDKKDKAMGQAATAFMDNADQVGLVLGRLEYKKQGPKVVPAS